MAKAKATTKKAAVKKVSTKKAAPKRTLEGAMRDAVAALKEKGIVIPTSTEKAPGKVKGAMPTGTSILVELLTAQELQGTTLFVPDDAKGKECEQAYIIAMGPKVPTDLGFKPGDRVMLAGGGANYLPQYDEGRKRIIIEPHVIRCVLTEE